MVPATVFTAAAVLGLAAAVSAETAGRWLLVTPPPVPEKRALIKVYSASSDADVRAAVASLPGDEQVRLVSKVYEILTIPTAAERTEALFDAMQDPAAPVAQWRRVEAFDSAASCEQERRRALQTFERAAARVRASSPDGDELTVDEWTIFEGLTACRSSRCVPESKSLAR
jgi:hypothetical protein